MRFGGGGWRPNNRRNRRQGRPSRGPTENGADRTLLVALVVFCVVALALAVVIGLALN